MQWGPLGLQVFDRTYSRTKWDGTKETWDEVVHRVVEGNLALVGERHHMPNEEQLLLDLIGQGAMMPAGRHLWVSGVAGRQFLFNCHRAGWTWGDLTDHFTFTFDELMKGGGVGANYSTSYMDRTPIIAQRPKLAIVLDRTHPNFDEVAALRPEVLVTTPIPVEDSREGWVDALRRLLDAATGRAPSELALDLSGIRPRGQEIRGFGGTAAGPGPLAAMLQAVATVFGSAQGRRLSSLEAMEIDHLIAEAVVAGNVRRSARMSIKHWNDDDIEDFINCKAEAGNHWTTNISVEVDDYFFEALDDLDAHAWAVLAKVSEGMLRNGEPGFFNSSLASVGELEDVRCTNPCGEIALEEWENCNLGHVNLAAPGDKDLRFELMTRFLLRATFGDIESPLQREVVQRNRRIGVGFYGYQTWLADVYGRSWSDPGSAPFADLRNYQSVVRQQAREYAHALRVPAPIKNTTVAPTGTIAKLTGDTEGMHATYARHFLRSVRYAADDPRLEDVTRDPAVVKVEDDLYSANTKVVYFNARDPQLDRLNGRAHLIEDQSQFDVPTALAHQAQVQSAWSDNAVSFTINVKPGAYEVEQLMADLREHLPWLKGTTVMVDESRPQAPFTRISAEEYEAHGYGDSSQAQADCATGACPVR